MHRRGFITILWSAPLLAACGASTAPVGTPATIYGFDDQGNAIDPVNLFRAYQPRGAKVGEAHNGEKVTLLRTEGQGALVRTAAGVEGWCNVAFVKR